MIVVWFSCGAASAVAAKKTIELYPGEKVRVVNSPVAEERPDNRRFLRDVEEWIGVEIETAKNSRYPSCSAEEVWEKEKYMAGPLFAPCTQQLKKEARYQWEEVNRPDWHVLGFTADERSRFERFALMERENTLPVLIDLGLKKQDCFDIIRGAGLALPDSYAVGYSNANCEGCVKASSPTYWNHVRKVAPEVFNKRAEQSRRLGARLVKVKGVRLFLDELDPMAKGRPMRNLSFECGIFCDISKTL